MLDVGFERPAPVMPTANVHELKELLDDPVEYFLGARGEAVVYPAPIAKHYGFPPSKSYVFRAPPAHRAVTRGFDPMLSFARGGLAEAWTAGCYEFSEADLRQFPFPTDTLRPYYAEVARRIGISAEHDDIAQFSPFTAPYLEPLPLDPHSTRLLARYATRRDRLQRLRLRFGRSRVATLSRSLDGRAPCSALGRCLWGCPHQALYAPSVTLRDCGRHPGFRYLPGHFVSHFEYDARGRVGCVVARHIDDGTTRRIDGDLFVLAAGTIGTTRIYLESAYRCEGKVLSLDGLMDNPHAVIPFVTPAQLGAPVDPASYQFHLLAFGIEDGNGGQEAHGQITTLRAAAVHPIVQSLPLDFRGGMGVFRRIRSALGVANVWRPATRSPQHTVSLAVEGTGQVGLHIECAPSTSEADRMRTVVATVRRGLRALGCVAPARMAQVLPLGSSVHYAGTIPMSADQVEHTTDPLGRVRGFQNLVVADGATFPTLPAKNLTFTLMANATRLATELPLGED